MLAGAVGRAHGEKEPVSEVESEVGIRHGLASGFLWGGKQKRSSASAAIALEIDSVIINEQFQDFLSLLFLLSVCVWLVARAQKAYYLSLDVANV